MATYREISYFVIDQVKAISDDSTITIDHVIFLLNYYRNYLIEQKVKTEGASRLTSASSQTICLDLQQEQLIPEDDCYSTVFRSVQTVPDLVDGTSATAYPINFFFNVNISVVSKERFRFVGHNKYMKNIIYLTISDDNKVYLKSNNPQYQYLDKIKLHGIFEDSQKAGELSCTEQGTVCDILDTDFPLDGALIPTIIEAATKVLSAAAWRQQDSTNDARDDLADLVAYLSRNTKSDLAKQLAS